mgnify:CR=1 FL=1
MSHYHYDILQAEENYTPVELSSRLFSGFGLMNEGACESIAG